MIYFVAPNGIGISTNHWNTAAGMPSGDLVTTVNSISPGDEIWVLGENNMFGIVGQYNLTAPLVINQNNLSIYGGFAGWETSLAQRNANIICPPLPPPPPPFPNYFQHPSVLDGGRRNRVIDIQGVNDCLIDGFLIRYGYATTAIIGLDGGGVRVLQSNDIRFENLVIMLNTAAQNGAGMYMDNAQNAFIKNVVFFGNFANGGNGGGLFLNHCNDATVVNALFNANYGMVGVGGGTGSGIYVDSSNNVQIINNTIADNIPNTATGSGAFCNNANVEIYNSIFYIDNLNGNGGNVSVEHCLLGIATANIPPIFINNSLTIGTNPNFVNPIYTHLVPPPPPPVPLPTMGDYHLQINPPFPLTSQCIDAGNDAHILPHATTDLEGNPRFINKGLNPSTPNTVDMGAFETP